MYEYKIAGVVAGFVSDQESCKVETVCLPHPEDLTCEKSGIDVYLSWENTFPYQVVEILRRKFGG